MTHTHTFATLEVPDSLYASIRAKLKAAGYDENITTITSDSGEKEIITMQGIALICEPRSSKRPPPPSPNKLATPHKVEPWAPLFPPQTLDMVNIERRLTEIENILAVMNEMNDLKDRLARIKVLIETPLTGPFREQIFVLAGGDPKTLPHDG